MEEATKCLFRTSLFSLLVGTDKYHIQVSHHLKVGKNALNEYDQYAIYLAILYHSAIGKSTIVTLSDDFHCAHAALISSNCNATVANVAHSLKYYVQCC